MTDDFLKDFEGELRAAAERRQGAADRPRRPWLTRVLVPAVAVASVAAFVLAVVLAGGSDPGEETVAATGPTGPDSVSATFVLSALTAGSACNDPQQRRSDPSPDRIVDSMAVLRRTQHSPDGVSDNEAARLPVTQYDPRATRAVSGLGERVLLVPSPAVNAPCGGGQHAGPGVCVVVHAANGCYAVTDVLEARALSLVEPGRVVGLAPDGVDQVFVESGGDRTVATVVENTFLAELPGVKQGDRVTVRHMRRALDTCTPPPAMRELIPVLDRPADPGGVPPAVRQSLRADLDSRIAAKYARIAGGGDGVTYWIVPWLKCEDEATDHDTVCVYPLFEGQEQGGGGGRVCATAEELESGKGSWIHFPLPDGGDAVAGFAPPGTTSAFLRINRDDYGTELPVEDGVFAGTLVGHALKGEVGGLTVKFDTPQATGTGPQVSVLNGTTAAGRAEEVMAELVNVNYRRGDIVNAPDQDVELTTVYYRDGFQWLGDRIAIYLGERHKTAKPRVAPMTAELARLLGDAAVVVGADLAER
jgi:hypothetical protein